MRGGVDFCKMVFCGAKDNSVSAALLTEHVRGELKLKLTQMRTRGVAASCIVVLSAYALECRGLVDRDAASPVLVFEVRVFYRRTEGRELVGLPKSHRGLRFWSG